MPIYIENVSYKDIQKGNHFSKGNESILIQIINPGHYLGFPKAKVNFLEVHQFEIFDSTDIDGFTEDIIFNEQQAVEIIKILVNALNSGKNVTVHCHMGISRSGAVARIGSYLGFQLRTNNQIPNRRMMQLLEAEVYKNYSEYLR